MSAALLPCPVRRALISVSDKTGLVDFTSALIARGVEILSTGGTARQLRESGLSVVEVSSYTEFPEIMDGRVKTLHPKVHAALLGRRGTDDALMQAHGIRPIDLLVVNLYPFEMIAAARSASASEGEVLANIDIGGVAMVRAAAKNYAAVAVVMAVADYPRVLAELDEHGGLIQTTRKRLAAQAFARTAQYDAAIAHYFMTKLSANDGEQLPQTFSLQLNKTQALRYGENPHQRAAFFQQPGARSVASATQLQGKTLSFNNIVDTDTALECVRVFEQPACVVVKHANPCGVAMADSLTEAYEQAYETDPTSAFGGIIAVNRPLDAITAAAIVKRQFVEVIIAPSIEDAALVQTAARKNIRVLAYGPWDGEVDQGYEVKCVRGGFLIQDIDAAILPAGGELRPVSRRHPSASELADLLFAWKVAKFVKSNAIVYARNGRTLGIGAGQMSRVDSARIGARKASDAGLGLDGAVLASDAFFPFRDAIDHAAAAGVRAIIQPGGSVRDDEVIAAADEHDIAMVFVGMRHFRH